MATVSSFEGLQPPTRSELRQFAELFTPLFVASSDEAKRQAVAALSQCKQIPQAVALFIGCQPIGIAAPFLTSSPSIDDDTLIAVARIQGIEHMRAIVSRDALSPRVIDVLVGLRHAAPRWQPQVPEAAQVEVFTEAVAVVDEPTATRPDIAPAIPTVPAAIAEIAIAAQEQAAVEPAPFQAAPIEAAMAEAEPMVIATSPAVVVAEPVIVVAAEPIIAVEERVPPARQPLASAPSPGSASAPAPATTGPDLTIDGGREEEVRDTLKGLARHFGRDDNDRLGLRTLSTLQSALLVRFARSREAVAFATTLADTLSASRWLSERILLDMSGQQMATTLTSIGMDFSDAVFVLEKLYPHLGEAQHSVTRAWMVLDALDAEECHARVESWRRADSYTYLPEQAPAAPAPTSHARAVHQPPARAMRLVGRSR
jgi:uncharacterized protein (DUF2336 family)